MLHTLAEVPAARGGEAPAGAARAAIAEESGEESEEEGSEAGGAGSPRREWSDGELRALDWARQTAALPQGDPRKSAASSVAWARVAAKVAARSGVGPRTAGAIYRMCVHRRVSLV